MAEPMSVSDWLEALKHGSEKSQKDAAQDLWSRYVRSLIRVANQQPKHARRRVVDEEDVVVRAFQSFLEGVQAGRFHQLKDRNDLWQIL